MPSRDARRKLLIDTDTASDDAVALILALVSPAVEVVGITTVAGNVPVEQATANALLTVELCAAAVPVHTGAAAPLGRPLEPADWFHGRDGLGDHGYRPARLRPEAEPAVEAILRLVGEHPGLEIITLGPLTNLAQALRREPAMAAQVSRCVVMGGAACSEGNVTPAAEYNFWVDPEAARMVMRSALPVELVGWELSRGPAVMNAAEIELALDLGTPLAEFAVRSNDTARAAYRVQTGEDGIALPDPVAMAILLEPALVLKASSHYVDVETESPLTRGMSVVDRLNVAADPRNQAVWRPVLEQGRRQRVVWEMDHAGWKRLLFEALAARPGE